MPNPIPVAPGFTGPTSGMLTLNIHEARLTRDTNTVTTMDPYLKLKVRMQEFKTKTRQNEGKNPRWEEMFEVKVDYIGDDIEFEMLTENSIASDKRIGTLRVKLSAMCVTKGVDDWCGLHYNYQVVG